VAQRLGPWVALVVVVAAMVAPALWRPPTDGYPLSTYPMFASDRGRGSAVATAVALDADGGRHRLSPEAIAGSDEPMLAIATVWRAVRADRAPQLCAEIGDRLGDEAAWVEVEVATERHDSVAWFSGEREPLAVDVHARCPVPS
jgi:hypothetical protein